MTEGERHLYQEAHVLMLGGHGEGGREGKRRRRRER